MKKATLNVYTDGASSGNPGPSGIGYVIEDNDGNIVFEYSEFIGNTTNNVAEYTALLRAIEKILELAPERVRFYSDSELLVKQLKGEYKVRNEKLIGLYKNVMSKLSLLNYDIIHVRRDNNKLADRLAKSAIKNGISSFTK
ncbi:ribonuclease HI family protein [Deferribacter autotrophicus]|uniref:Ribonuclease HI family protein n=1 Tax=Deferribacter autotrophicus TaxID=500465 RepID=A0A5A8F5L1_9BACT|nr:ribonuclease HI family protein [Deferribacter autotrophicus]KAA0259424.1 ribonuclease HI family protein [Deferribacter autotrophicus]